MNQITAALALLLAATPAYAQFGRLGDVVNKADKAKKTVDALNINEKDERAIGEAVSARLIDRFGVYQDPAVAKYVTLVGTVLTQASSRPSLPWQFIVLDSEGVNAYAAPGGLVHITKGALGLIKSEAELAGVLGHEIVHVTAKHTIEAIKKARIVDAGSDAAGSAAGGLTGTVLNRLSDAAYDNLFENKLDRDDENEADKEGLILASKVGYAPSGLSDFLNHLSDRNRNAKEKNGLFASHPETKDRLAKIDRTIKSDKLTSTAKVQARYASVITFDAKPAAEITSIEAGAKGVAGGGTSTGAPSKEEPKKEEAKKEEPKKSRFGGLASALTGGKQAESTQASAAGSSRMAAPDKDAPGGPHKTPVRVAITAAELDAFKKGIA